MKRSRDRSRYEELSCTRPSVPSCTAPLVLVSQGAFTTLVPCGLPPLLPVLLLSSLLLPSLPLFLLSSSLLSPLLCFSVEYRHHSEQLVVSLLRLSNLPPCFRSNLTLIELRLLPDDRRPNRPKPGTQAPTRSSTTAHCSSVGPDSKHRLVGRLEVPLRGDLCHTGRVQWRALQTQPQPQSDGLGELLVSLSYSSHRLHVNLIRAKGLTRDDCRSSGFVVQVSVQVQSQVKSKQSPVLESEEDLNLKYSFKSEQKQLEQSCESPNSGSKVPGKSVWRITSASKCSRKLDFKEVSTCKVFKEVTLELEVSPSVQTWIQDQTSEVQADYRESCDRRKLESGLNQD
ncbi:hypothetical protein WMY93_009985 [Mugilogobius chulae]|uniref:Uncharacterized protein n=1 Tax=Mugilogobius chulae TaxID=88201 RepID=A0AAW0PHL0_9GOBI